jgi:hypothetical protein
MEVTLNVFSVKEKKNVPALMPCQQEEFKTPPLSSY